MTHVVGGTWKRGETRETQPKWLCHERKRQKDRKTERQKDRKTERQKDRKTEREPKMGGASPYPTWKFRGSVLVLVVCGSAGEEGFLAGYSLPAALAVNVDMRYAKLAIERLTALCSADAPETVDHSGIEKNANLNVRGDEDGIFCVGRSDGGEERILVDDPAGGSGSHEIVAIDTFEEGGVAEKKGAGGFSFEVDEFLAIFFGTGGVGGSLFLRAALLRASGNSENKQKSE
jgi:hypothetical protein